MKPVQTSTTLLAALALLHLTSAAPTEEVRTVDDSSSMVRTPAGLRPIANIHAVPEGGSVSLVDEVIHLLDGTGTVTHTVTNDHTVIGKSNATATTGGPLPEESGWVAYAYWFNEASAAINSFTTSWEVPPVPATNHDQTLFLFNSIEPASGDAILQPVLQFGESAAGGGSYWAVASWYLVGSQVFFSSLVEVSPGDVLTGVIELTSSSGSSYNYVSSFTGISGTSVTATGSDVLVWATETLETYSTEEASDYPTGSTSFFDINISVTSGTPETEWTTVSDSADDISATVATQGFSNAEVVIQYP